jgi:hypothetical protein
LIPACGDRVGFLLDGVVARTGSSGITTGALNPLVSVGGWFSWRILRRAVRPERDSDRHHRSSLWQRLEIDYGCRLPAKRPDHALPEMICGLRRARSNAIQEIIDAGQGGGGPPSLDLRRARRRRSFDIRSGSHAPTSSPFFLMRRGTDACAHLGHCPGRRSGRNRPTPAGSRSDSSPTVPRLCLAARLLGMKRRPVCLGARNVRGASLSRRCVGARLLGQAWWRMDVGCGPLETLTAARLADKGRCRSSVVEHSLGKGGVERAACQFLRPFFQFRAIRRHSFLQPRRPARPASRARCRGRSASSPSRSAPDRASSPPVPRDKGPSGNNRIGMS